MTSYTEETMMTHYTETPERIPFMEMQGMIPLMLVMAGTLSSVEMAAIISKSLMVVT